MGQARPWHLEPSSSSGVDFCLLLLDCLLLPRVWEHMKVLLLLFASGVAWMGPPRRPMNVPRAVAEPEVLRPESVEELDVDALEWKLLKSMRQCMLDYEMLKEDGTRVLVACAHLQTGVVNPRRLAQVL